MIFGNLAFNSPHSFIFVPRTRRDDIFSILYILIHLYTDETPLCQNFDNRNCKNVTEQIKKIGNMKINSSVKELCKKTPFLEEFARYTYQLKFEEEPNYNYLKFNLAKQLLDLDIAPNK